jgi:two-component system, NarL family, nitrate/nitrite response regulator NarL
MSGSIPTVIFVLVTDVLRREGIASILKGTPYKVVPVVGRPTELTDHDVAKEGRALAIVGIDSGSGNLGQAAESVRLLRSLMPDGKIVLVAETSRPVDLQSVLALAPDGYILNLGSRDLLLKSLELIFMDQQIFVLGGPTAALPDGGHATQLLGRAVGSQSGSSDEVTKNIHQFSHRERQVLICLARGGSNKVIARLCQISEATVKVYLKSILRKTHAQNRTQAAIWAIEHGLADAKLAP